MEEEDEVAAWFARESTAGRRGERSPNALCFICIVMPIVIHVNGSAVVVERDLFILQTNGSNGFISATIWSAGSGSRSRFKLIRISRVGLQG